MQVSLSKTSWHSQYYYWVKGYYPTYEFKSLCPYFWTIILFLLLSPVFLVWKLINLLVNNIVIPTKNVVNLTVSKLKTEPKKEPKKEHKPNKLSMWFKRSGGKIFKYFSYTYLITCLIFLSYVFFETLIKSLNTHGFWMTIVYIFSIIGGLTTLVFVIWGIMTIFETDTWRMIKGMSYSIKNKVCPMIEWKTNENTDIL